MSDLRNLCTCLTPNEGSCPTCQVRVKRKDAMFMERLRKSKEKWAEVLKRLARDD